MRAVVARVLPILCALPALASAGSPAADGGRCVDVEFTPTDKLQIVAWVETAAGEFVDTIYITQQTGTFGLGNRPGRFDFNSGPKWDYGRRITTFPVWSHRNGESFPVVLFQSMTGDDPDGCAGLTGTEAARCGENNLSHDFNQSSAEHHYCRPLDYYDTDSTPAGGDRAIWDTGTCASPIYSDKGKLSATFTTGYPPRSDLVRTTGDLPSVDMYRALNPFDAVSQPTPVGGMVTHAPWSSTMTAGDYVLYIETALESDFNATYTSTTYPSPTGIQFGDYGLPYRGQPSVLYRLPFTVGATPTTASATDYVGYGSPDDADGDIRPPDATISVDTPGSGGARLELVSDGGSMYRVRVSVDPNQGAAPPSAPAALAASAITANTMTVGFTAPGIGPAHAPVSGYEIRIRASDEMTAANFADSMPVTAQVTPAAYGEAQTFDLDGLLPETDYWIGIRAFDNCHDAGDLAITHVVTTARVSGAVDACFVATAAYGSLLANDVELLRHTRDVYLRSNALGELGVEAYYTFGPLLAAPVGESELLRAAARALLAPLVERVRHLAA